MGFEKNLFYHLDGLGNLPQSTPFSIGFDGEYVLLDQLKLKIFGKNETVQQYKIKAADILDFGIVNTAELKNKSVIGRGVAGGLLFGPVGALLGGMSGANQQKIKSTLAICYLPSTGGDPKTVIFDAEPPSWGSMNKVAASKMQRELTKNPKSEAVMAYLGQTVEEDGSILL